MDAEIIIVGAGPAGSTLARLLAQSGREVLVLDRAKFPRPKTCGGGLTPPAKALLPSLPGVWRGELRRLTFRYRGEDSLSLDSPEPLTYLVDRAAFDAALLDLARRAGARVHTGETLKGVAQDDAGVTISSNATTYRAALAVGADGALGRFGPALGLGGGRQGLALEVEIPLGENSGLSGEGVIDFGFGTPGYGWFFPKEGLSSVGLGSYALAGDRLKGEYQAFLQSLGLEATAGAQVRRGHPLPVAGTGGPLVGLRTAVIGDAAGLADPFTGEGLRYALLSAQLLAETILAPGAAARGDLTPYEAAVESRILQDLRLASRLSRLFHPLAPRLHRYVTSHPDAGDGIGHLVAAWLGEELGYGEFFREFRSRLWKVVGHRLRSALG